jgi:PKD repeat protein
LRGRRGSPDICGNADPDTGYQIYYADWEWLVIGGTSAVSPLFAGLVARINQANQANRAHGYHAHINTGIVSNQQLLPVQPIGNVHQLLYSNPSIFNGITRGTNGAYRAGKKWDPCAGNGSLDGTRLLGLYTNPSVPVARFVVTPRKGIAPLVVQFTDFSTNLPSTWLWDFGNGNTSNEQNPQHVYDVAGSYTVTLTATNSAGPSAPLTQHRLIVIRSPPVADFSIESTGSRQFAFSDTSTNTPTSWRWWFGDGTTSNQQNPMHVYKNNATYHVHLSVKNSHGKSSITKSLQVPALDRIH